MAERECGRFDLVVSDIGLPDGSGLTLMAQLRARYPALRGIALSGYGMEDDIRRSQQAGFLLHLTKPINFSSLTAAVQHVLAHHFESSQGRNEMGDRQQQEKEDEDEEKYHHHQQQQRTQNL